MAQYLLLNLLQRFPWIEAQLVAEQPPRASARRESISLALAPVEPDHQGCPQTFPERMPYDQ
jgi:hypothetical protein